MNKKTKRILTVILSVLLIFNCIPYNVVRAANDNVFTIKNVFDGGNVSNMIVECNGVAMNNLTVTCEGQTPVKFEGGKSYRISAVDLYDTNFKNYNAPILEADSSSSLVTPLPTITNGSGDNTFTKAMTGQLSFNFIITVKDSRITITFDKNGGKDGFAGKFDGTKVILGDSFNTKHMTESLTFDKNFEYIYAGNTSQIDPSIYTATIDFKDIETNEDAKDLVGTGFSVTCQTCLGFVCIKFVDGTDVKLNHVEGIEWGDHCSDHNDRSVVFEIGVDDCNNGSDIVKKIMDNAIFINTKLVALTDKTIDSYKFEYGLDYTMTKDSVVGTKCATQILKCTNDNKEYMFTGSWVFEKNDSGENILTKKFERHYVLLGGELISQNPNTYGTKMIITDPRSSGNVTPTEELYKEAVREGIYYKALINSIKVSKTFNESVFPENPFLSPDGNKVFVGWTTTKDDSSTLITLEDITKEDDLTVYALWAPLDVVEQPSSSNGFKYKTNINDKWSQKNKLVEKLYIKNEEGSFEEADSLNQSGTYKYKLTYGSSYVFTNEFEYVKKSSKTYKVSNVTSTGEKISGSGKKNSTRTIISDNTKKVVDVIVKDKNGNLIDVQDNGDGTYSFKQPASDVTVEVLYTEKTLEEKMQDSLMQDDVKKADSNEGAKINPNAKFVKGYDDGNFKPNNKVTNIELMCMVTQLFEDSNIVIAKELDLNQGDNEWAGNIVALCNGLDLIPGNKNDKNYNLYGDVTRGDLAKVIYELIKDYSPSESLDNRENCKDAIGKDYEKAVCKLVDLGILKGFDDGLFHGENTLTRAEAVVVINRALQSLGFEIKMPSIKLSFPDLSENHWAYAEIMYAANK